ncbi:UPF0481 protein At3g47200-like [Oryza brachyantha]|uniref:UPF0481 protein At3g47200-like n=1 Tax=Oryza brachyantha TaxID=4533 RepID=UPI001ADB0430|nr:UPF0481 protein At3g47200-like [Oryza brachyantha]
MAAGEAVVIDISLKHIQERMDKIPVLGLDDDILDAAVRQISRIHVFPRGLRGIGGPDDRYTVPSFVAIGPYHHGQPHLQDMEEVKLAAARRFVAESKRSLEDVYVELLSVVGDVRGCYAEEEKVRGFGDANLATMMLVDGCFLLQFMVGSKDRMLSSEYGILKDMMLLENQIPWLVLETLMKFHDVDVDGFVAEVGDKFFPREESEGCCSWIQSVCGSWQCRNSTEALERSVHGSHIYKARKPTHLLDLLRLSQIWCMPQEHIDYKPGHVSLLSSSAVELAQIGVNLRASAAAWFGDMSVRKGRFWGGELSLSPVFLNDVTACWLVNMAALEAAGGNAVNGSAVSSYLSVLAMLMDREEDVQQLRGRRVVLSTFSNTQTLEFFKRIGQHLSFHGRYLAVLEQIEAYRRNRPVMTSIHKFVYNNYKVVGIILSIASVLVGIFKALRGR